MLDTLFPVSCISCRCDGEWFCEECLEKIRIIPFQVCPKCEKNITESGRSCPNCKPFSTLDAMLVSTSYKEGLVAKLVHLYKYRFVQDLHIPLGKMLVRSIIRSELPLPDLIVPVPLHKKRLRWRGFNQAGLLAEYVAKNLTAGFEIRIATDVLERRRFTQPQMKVKRYSERQNNLKDAFFLESDPPKDSDPEGKIILLIDDIATTGSTLYECAKILKKGGAKKVFSAVIDRQEIRTSKTIIPIRQPAEG